MYTHSKLKQLLFKNYATYAYNDQTISADFYVPAICILQPFTSGAQNPATLSTRLNLVTTLHIPLKDKTSTTETKPVLMIDHHS